MLRAGFDEFRGCSIRRDACTPLARYLGERVRDPDMRRVTGVPRATFSTPGAPTRGPWADYLIAVGAKR